MPRAVTRSVRARGSLAVDREAKGEDATGLPERFCAWDEDRTTLAIDATRALAWPAGRDVVAFVGPRIDLETLRIALDLPEVHLASDPLAVARSVSRPALAIGCPDDHTAIAALVDESGAPDVAAPQDVSGAPVMVSPMRALHEARRVPPSEHVPDSPMGAYVPWGTWVEDLPARLRLLAQSCAACARVQYPPRAACASCRGRAFGVVELPREARVYAATRIGRGGAPSEFALEQMQVGAYWVAVVEWPVEGVRVTARLSGFDEVGPAIGAPVVARVRRLFEQEGRVRYGVKFAAV